MRDQRAAHHDIGIGNDGGALAGPGQRVAESTDLGAIEAGVVVPSQRVGAADLHPRRRFDDPEGHGAGVGAVAGAKGEVPVFGTGHVGRRLHAHRRHRAASEDCGEHGWLHASDEVPGETGVRDDQDAPRGLARGVGRSCRDKERARRHEGGGEPACHEWRTRR